MSQAHSTQITTGCSLGYFTLDWFASHVHGVLAALAGIDFSRLCSDLAHLGAFLAATAAIGTFGLNVVDRVRGRTRGAGR